MRPPRSTIVVVRRDAPRAPTHPPSHSPTPPLMPFLNFSVISFGMLLAPHPPASVVLPSFVLVFRVVVRRDAPRPSTPPPPPPSSVASPSFALFGNVEEGVLFVSRAVVRGVTLWSVNIYGLSGLLGTGTRTAVTYRLHGGIKYIHD